MNFYNEMYDANGGVRAHYKGYEDWLKATPPERIERKRAEADLAFHRVGITFAVYGEEAGKERLIPFDIIPRVIPSAEWKALQSGLRQRVKALNMFLRDIYHGREVLRDLLEIARTSVSHDEDSEVDETALAELTEFARMCALLLRSDLRPARTDGVAGHA